MNQAKQINRLLESGPPTKTFTVKVSGDGAARFGDVLAAFEKSLTGGAGTFLSVRDQDSKAPEGAGLKIDSYFDGDGDSRINWSMA